LPANETVKNNKETIAVFTLRFSPAALRPARTPQGVTAIVSGSSASQRISGRGPLAVTAAPPLLCGGNRGRWTLRRRQVTGAEGAKRPSTHQKETVQNRSDERRYKGVCMTCKHRETCERSTIQDGVWHCDKYE